MKEIEMETQEEKLNKSSHVDDSESFHALEAALEKGIDNLIQVEPVQLDAEFMSGSTSKQEMQEVSGKPAEEEWPQPRALKEEAQKDSEILREEDSGEDEEADAAPVVEKTEESRKIPGKNIRFGSFGKNRRNKKLDGNDNGAGEIDDGSDDEEEIDEFEEGELLDEEYLRSEAYRRREKRHLSLEQREERRAERVAAFWDFIDTNRRQIRWIAIGITVLIAVGIAAVVIRNWTYSEYKELVVSEKEDTISVSYADVNGKILKYGVDGAMLVDQSNDMEWTISYDMNAPKLIQCEATFAIYDSKGTNICICNSNGQIGSVSTDLPIVKADVSRQGVVAAILEDGQNAWIRCYDKEGSEIATLKTTFTTPGYPMDLALSENGNLLAVDYLSLDSGTPVSKIAFYNFGTVGRNQKDNLVAETDYRDRIVPEVSYMDGSTCVVFGEKGFSIFTGSQIPVEDIKVEVSQSIVSTFHDSNYIGLVLQNRNPDNQYLICLYNRKGKEILRKETDFKYETIEMNGEQILLASRDEFCVYSTQGVEKFRGSLQVPASEFLGFGRNKFIYVSEDTFRIIRLG